MMKSKIIKIVYNLLVTFSFGLGCVSLKNKYVNEVIVSEESKYRKEITTEISLLDEAELRMTYIKRGKEEEHRLTLNYEGRFIHITKQLELIADDKIISIDILKRKISPYGRYSISELLYLSMDKEILSLILNSKNVSFKMIGENGSSVFRFDETGKQLLSEFKREYDLMSSNSID